jgi:hypothetical protein
METRAGRYVKLGNQYLPRIELTLRETPDGSSPDSVREVHLYEVYWAPLTEGRVTLRETAAFLWDAGFTGLGHFLSRHPFDRWMFGGMKNMGLRASRTSRVLLGLLWLLLLLTGLTLIGGLVTALASPALREAVFGRLPPMLAIELGVDLTCFLLLVLTANRTTRSLLLALLIFGALVVMNGAIVAVAGSRTLTGGKPGWPSNYLLAELTLDLLVALLLIAPLVLVGIGLPLGRRSWLTRRRARSLALGSRERGLYRTAIWVALGVVIASGGVVLLHLALNRRGGEFWWPYRLVSSLVTPGDASGQLALRWWLIGSIWLAVALLSGRVRSWLLQYLGDVAIYVSSHRLSRFAETRDAIQATARRVIEAVYGAQGPASPALAYPRVVVVGHSLGSLVVYDALNAAFSQDALLDHRLRVKARTAALITFGSPLDKTAFIFRTQLAEGRLREMLAAAVQPIIVDPATRPDHWINLWSRDDWVSGNLTFYDDPAWDAADARRVQNREDPEACTPGLCHNDYWTNALLGRAMAAAIRGESALAEFLRATGPRI